MPESIELRDYGRLLKDGELRIKAHDDQKIRVRYIVACDFVLCLYSESRLFYIFVVDACFHILLDIVCCQLTNGNVFLYLFQIYIHL